MFKFKMNERSLFAVLLRSPWWVSLLIVLVFGLVARALLPPDYARVVVLGTFPFMVIAAMAAWRQWRNPSAARLDAALERAAGLGWREFAAWLEQVHVRQGYVVRRLDGEAADFRLERQGQLSLLSCRRWKAASHGVEALRALQAACEQQGASGIYLSLGPVSEAAARHAREHGLQLLHGHALARLLLT
jgi:restriction system protein